MERTEINKQLHDVTEMLHARATEINTELLNLEETEKKERCSPQFYKKRLLSEETNYINNIINDITLYRVNCSHK